MVWYNPSTWRKPDYVIDVGPTPAGYTKTTSGTLVATPGTPAKPGFTYGGGGSSAPSSGGRSSAPSVSSIVTTTPTPTPAPIPKVPEKTDVQRANERLATIRLIQEEARRRGEDISTRAREMGFVGTLEKEKWIPPGKVLVSEGVYKEMKQRAEVGGEEGKVAEKVLSNIFYKTSIQTGNLPYSPYKTVYKDAEGNIIAEEQRVSSYPQEGIKKDVIYTKEGPMYTGAASPLVTLPPPKQPGESYIQWYKKGIQDVPSTISAIDISLLLTGGKFLGTKVTTKAAENALAIILNEPKIEKAITTKESSGRTLALGDLAISLGTSAVGGAVMGSAFKGARTVIGEFAPNWITKAADFGTGVYFKTGVYGGAIQTIGDLATGNIVDAAYSGTEFAGGLVGWKAGERFAKGIILPPQYVPKQINIRKSAETSPQIRDVLESENMDLSWRSVLRLEEKTTLSKEQGEQMLQGIKSEQIVEKLYRKLNVEEPRSLTPELFPKIEQDVLKTLIVSEGTKAGSTAILSREKVRETIEQQYKQGGLTEEQYNLAKQIGDIDISVNKYKPKISKVTLNLEDVPVTLKAKGQLVGVKEFVSTFKEKKAKEYEKKIRKTKANKDFDIEVLPGLEPIQRTALETLKEAKVVGTTRDLILYNLLKKGEIIDADTFKQLTEGKTLIGKDVDFRAKSQLQYNKLLLNLIPEIKEKYGEDFGFVERKLSTKKEGRYLVGEEGYKKETGQLSAFKEIETGKSYQYGESIKIASRDITYEEGKKFGLLGGLTKGEELTEQFEMQRPASFKLFRVVDIAKKELGSEEVEPYPIDIALGSKIERTIDRLRKGKNIKIYGKDNKLMFEIQKPSSRYYDQVEGMINNVALEKVEKKGGKVKEDILLGLADLDRKLKVSTKGAEALSAEKILELSTKDLLLIKEGARQVIYKKPLIETEEPIKQAEFYNKKDFLTVFKEKPIKLETEFGKLDIQPRLSSTTANIQAQTIRGKFGDISQDMDKDLLRGRAIRLAQFKLLKEKISGLREGAKKKRFTALYNKAIKLALQYEGKEIVENSVTKLLGYEKNLLSFKKESDLLDYEVEMAKSSKVINLKGKEFNIDKLSKELNKQIEYKVGFRKDIYGKALGILKEKVGKKTLGLKEAEISLTESLKEVELDIYQSRKEAGLKLQSEFESGKYKYNEYPKEIKGYPYSNGSYYNKDLGYKYISYLKDKYRYTKYPNYKEQGYIKAVSYSPYKLSSSYYNTPYIPKDYITYTPDITETTTYEPPYIPRKKKATSFLNEPKKLRLLKKAIGYDVLKIVKGKPQTVARGLYRGAAMDIGAREVLKNLRATFILKKSELEPRDISTMGEFGKYSSLFREPVSKSKYRKYGEVYIQKQRKVPGLGRGRLSFPGELKEINMARMLR